MVEELTATDNGAVWVNLGLILKMTRSGTATQITFVNGKTIQVLETPQEIAKLANSNPKSAV
ncbi:hypothetical protein UP10_13850 [Bradyrhizobium sp. LTSPM299]|uniref:flagellar FlbD family protein n=1 Tax=Bradyrhizobium sp. LTSPM299 TaxID=1619233 RepID=UPI0005CB4548|nr:flagellar FlbD family protein [Bradyrhizobium sp. LTSPM299]KJC60225.1 hypothetical protein UP10_13850 [Bradyrhizobium sp. LTSPM299]